MVLERAIVRSLSTAAAFPSPYLSSVASGVSCLQMTPGRADGATPRTWGSLRSVWIWVVELQQVNLEVPNKEHHGHLRGEKLLMVLEDKYQVLHLIFWVVGELRKERRGRGRELLVQQALSKPESWKCFSVAVYGGGIIWVLTKKGFLFF